MKKLNLFLVLSMTITGAVALNQTAHADDSKNTNASVVVNPGELKMKTVSDIQFPNVQINGTDQNVDEKEGTTAKVAVEDFRGSSSKGWSLKARLKEGNFNGLGLKLVPAINTNKTAAVAAPATQNLNTQESLVASVADDKIVGSDFDTEVQLNAKLNIPARTKANTYTTTIVWNLAATPETKP
ncbi:WxL domain-containing protein [Enterococcus faecalis]|nr:WxL domain-containing protein [Enterococcus faecalis]NSN50295.1 WxL domain-containing protein [Enterococcus faecalis]